MSIYYQNRTERFNFYTSHNNTYATHLHKQVELIVVLEGNIILTVNSKTYSLNANEGAIVFPNELHSLKTENESEILLCIFDTDFCHSFQSIFLTQSPVSHSFYLQTLSRHSKLAASGLLSLTNDFPKGSPIPVPIQTLSKGYLTLLLADLFTYLPLTTPDAQSDLELEQRILIYIDEHFTENLSLDVLSKQFGISRYSLSRIFTDKLNTSFPYYVNAKRLEYAKDLLCSTSLSVTRIAMDAGFGSSRTFFREFKAYFLATPNEYRKKHAHI